MRHSQTPWLSVIMPVYCGEQWIDQALASIANEKAEGIEILVFDSSPSSASMDIVRRYMDCLDLRIIDSHEFRMWHSKTNAGVKLAKANHVCWLHVDDLWLPGRAAAVRSWILEAPQAALHVAPGFIIDRHNKALGTWRCPFSKSGEIPSALFLERLMVQDFISAPAPVFRRDVWLDCGGLDETLWYTADWDIWLKLAASGAVFFHKEVTTGFRIHGNSLTVTGSHNIDDFKSQMQTVFDRHLPRILLPRSAERAGRVSINVNTALAAAAAGDYSRLAKMVSDILRLGPMNMHRYFRDSRIWDRLQPRIRAKLAGAL